MMRSVRLFHTPRLSGSPGLRFLLLIGFSILFLCACSDNATNPDDGPDPGPEPVATATIGAEGGEIGTEDITITVPAGALDEDYTLNLYAEGLDDLPTCNSGPFQLVGLPEDADGPLTFRLRTDPADEGEPHLGFCFPEAITTDGDTLWGWQYVEAVEADGFVTAQWPILTETSGRTPGQTRPDLTMMARDPFNVSGFIFISVFMPSETLIQYFPSGEERHFSITYPVILMNEIDDLGIALEQAYQTFHDLGFDYTLAQAANTPLPRVDVTFSYYSAGQNEYVLACGVRAPDSDNIFSYTAFMRIYFERMDPGALPTTCKEAQSFFFKAVHDAQISQEGWNLFAYRLEWAVALWAERLFYTEPDHTPSECVGNLGRIGLGPKATLEDQWGDNSYAAALAALLTYLWDDDLYGTQPLLDMYADIRTGVEPFDAFIEHLPSDSDVWWPDFFQELMTGGIYAVSAGEFLPHVSQTVALDQAEMQTSVTDPYENLSARYYRIDLEHPDWDTGAYLDLDVTSSINENYLEIQFYALDGQALQHLASGGSVRINGLADFQAAGQDLLVVVVDADLAPPDMTPVDVTLELDVANMSVPDVFQLQQASILVGSAESHMVHEGEDCTVPDSQGTIIFEWDNKDGQWLGTTFISTWDDTWTEMEIDYRDFGSLSLTMDPQGLNVTDWSCENTRIQTGASSITTTVTQADWTGCDIPVNENPGAWTVRYTLDGAQIGDCIEVSRTTTYVDWDCVVTLNYLVWSDYSLMQVGFNP